MKPTHHPTGPCPASRPGSPIPRAPAASSPPPGLPFEHYCSVCGRRGALGLAYDPAKGSDGTWFCEAHVPASFHRYRAA
ncbi:hypothetical protein ACX4MV_05525 [Roseomonas mucosa]